MPLRKRLPSRLCRAVERPDHPSLGRDIGELHGLGKMGILLEGELKKGRRGCDHQLQQPEGLLESLEFAREAGLAIVIGTTGLSQEQIERMRELSKETSDVSFHPI